MRPKPLKEILQQIHRTDQILAQVRDFPEILKKFYDGLNSQNFSKLQALYLAGFLAPTLWTHCFGMPAVVVLNEDDLMEEVSNEDFEEENEDED